MLLNYILVGCPCLSYGGVTDYRYALFKDSMIVESSTEIYTEDADAFGTSRKETK